MHDAQSLIEQAEAGVDAVDWSRTLDPNDRVVVASIVSGIPPLTLGMMAMLVDFRSWLRDAAPDQGEVSSVERRLVGAWLMADHDGPFVRDLLTALLIRGELLRLPADERDSLRAPLRERFEALVEAGTEVDAEEGSPATEESLADYMQRSAIRHEMWLSTLRRM